MPVVKLTLEYDGTRYVGWQRQTNGNSIHAELDRALEKLHKSPRRTTGASRTDAGVHARGQVASFAEPAPLPADAYVLGMNKLLPDDIAVRAMSVEADDFDARRSSRGKRYRYSIHNTHTRAPLTRPFTWQVYDPLDVTVMRAASPALIGRHDFSSFRAADCQAEHAMREVRSIEIAGETNGEITIDVEATAFLRHMVRNIIGTLVEIGHGSRAPDSMDALLACRDRTQAGSTAPPQGLCLEEVFY